MKNLIKIEKLIVKGEISSAKEALREVKVNHKSSENFLIKFAELCRRLSLNMLAINKLRPFVRKEGRRVYKSSDKLLVEFAFNLHWLGINSEAQRIFDKVDLRQNPSALLGKSFIHFQSWNYEEASTLLERYVLSDELSDYHRAIGETNLLLSYVENLDEKSISLSRELIRRFQYEGYELLLGHVYKLIGQYYLLIFSPKQAIKYLLKSSNYLSDRESYDFQTLEKWMIIYELQMGIKVPEERVSKLKHKTLMVNDYEISRDIDFWRAIYSENKITVNEIYWRNHYPHYKKRVKKIGSKFNITNFDQRINSHQKGTFFDFRKGTINNISLPKGEVGAINKLNHIVLGDKYRKYNALELCDKLFEDHEFHYKYSRDKLHQLLGRTRKLYKREKLDLSLTCKNRRYNILSGGNLKFFFSEKNQTTELTDGEKRIVSIIKNKRIINSKELVAQSQISARGCQFFLKNLVEKNVINKERKGRTFLYSLREHD